MVRYSRHEIAEKIKRVMLEFVKANSTTWQKNHPPFIKDVLADLTITLMADAWDAGYAAYYGEVPAAPNPYRKESTS